MAGYWSDKFFATIWDIRLVNDTDPTRTYYVYIAFKWEDTIFLRKQRIIQVAPEYSFFYPDQLFLIYLQVFIPENVTQLYKNPCGLQLILQHTPFILIF